MKKSTYIVLAALLLFFLSAMWLLKSYSLELIHVVVAHTVIQKAPPDYPASKIEKAFDDAFQQAQAGGWKDRYKSELLAISQRLEKIQKLDAAEVDQLLRNLGEPAEKSQ